MGKAKLQSHLSPHDVDVVQKLLRNVDDGVRLWVRAKPGARRAQLTLVDEQLVVSVTAPPVDGKANADIVACVAALIGVRKSQVRLHTGARARDKELHVDGLDAEALACRLCGL